MLGGASSTSYLAPEITGLLGTFARGMAGLKQSVDAELLAGGNNETRITTHSAALIWWFVQMGKHL